ncbi:MAG: hypothetical protein IEMM0002_1498 [bacterium]|nr:MAG: hypothetical protein IEMM0002_1498 [bacterium]
MAKFYDALYEEREKFIMAQKIFLYRYGRHAVHPALT